MEVNLIAEALKFMVLGMGVVLLFLVTLIFILKVQAKLAMKYFPAKENKSAKVNRPRQQTTSSSDDTAKKIAAITAAIQHHRNQKG